MHPQSINAIQIIIVGKSHDVKCEGDLHLPGECASPKAIMVGNVRLQSNSVKEKPSLHGVVSNIDCLHNGTRTLSYTWCKQFKQWIQISNNFPRPNWGRPTFAKIFWSSISTFWLWHATFVVEALDLLNQELMRSINTVHIEVQTCLRILQRTTGVGSPTVKGLN